MLNTKGSEPHSCFIQWLLMYFCLISPHISLCALFWTAQICLTPFPHCTHALPALLPCKSQHSPPLCSLSFSSLPVTSSAIMAPVCSLPPRLWSSQMCFALFQIPPCLPGPRAPARQRLAGNTPPFCLLHIRHEVMSILDIHAAAAADDRWPPEQLLSNLLILDNQWQ